jgi:hypothetical protein
MTHGEKMDEFADLHRLDDCPKHLFKTTAS